MRLTSASTESNVSTRRADKASSRVVTLADEELGTSADKNAGEAVPRAPMKRLQAISSAQGLHEILKLLRQQILQLISRPLLATQCVLQAAR